MTTTGYAKARQIPEVVKTSVFVWLAAVACLWFAPASAYAASITATAIHVEGDVKVIAAADAKTSRVDVGRDFYEGDRIITGPSSALEIEFSTKDRIRLGESSDLTIKSLQRKSGGATKSIFGLLMGRVRSIVSKLATEDSQFEYQTRVAIVGVAGTDFVTELPDDRTLNIYVLPKGKTVKPGGEAGYCQDSALWQSGKVYVKGRDPGKTVLYVDSCFMTTVLLDQPPQQPVIIPDAKLYDFTTNLPFSVKETAPSDEMMMDNIARRVSVPLIDPGVRDDSQQRLDNHMDQGYGLSSRAGHNGLSNNDASVRGSITIQINQ